MFEAIHWPEEMAPSRSPHPFHGRTRGRGIELAKPAPDIVWRTHEALLENLARAAVARERA